MKFELALPYSGPLRVRSDASTTAIVRSLASFLPIALVLAIAIVTRVWGLDRLGYNTDEAVYSGQAAAIANDPELRKFFPVFRAHPLLFQTILSVPYLFGVSDITGRLVSAGLGIATVYIVFLLGQLLYGRRIGLLAALLMALLPYHVIVTRQLLLDGPATFFSTLTLYLMARYVASERGIWLVAAGAGCGLSFLAKETTVVATTAGMYAFFALAASVRLRARDLLLSLLCMAIVIAPYPITLVLAGRGDTGKAYLIWQLLRRPNHDLTFYPTILPVVIGPLVILAAVLGLVILRRQNTWRETLLACWTIMPLAFFELWPVKGFQYALPITPAVVLLAARALSRIVPAQNILLRWPNARRVILLLPTLLVVASLIVPTLQQIQPAPTNGFLAGTGGTPGGRELGVWIQGNLPENAQLLTIGPSMANLIQYYGHRKAYGLAVSPNPLHRNPSYEPIVNPDRAIRDSELQYVVWDAYSAERSTFFEESLFAFVRRYNGRIIHVESIDVLAGNGEIVSTPAIVIYEVRPT